MKIVYISHPISGDIEGNLAKIRGIIQHINLTMPDVVPFVPYYADIVSLDDSDVNQRNRGINNHVELFFRKIMDEIWLYGDNISEGMQNEIDLALMLDIPVRVMSPFIASYLRITEGSQLITQEQKVR